ncbi:MAG: hypothetical protein RQ733_09205 [Methyloprofundus sp.]|nr:hypothetical protein [Methyloprofundus sp.]MDT8426137.1 hypothetical protein [Methyloprofundus sp.]
MKCIYYLTSSLDSTRKITEDLHQAGINDWFIHVLSHDESGLKKEKIHSSNYLEQLDILRYGVIGAISGLVIGLIAASLVNTTELFGSAIPNAAYYGIILFFTCFGAWEGGLTGIATENRKIALFHDDLESGSYLILIYTKKAAENVLKKLMETQHPEAELVAIDTNFYNPLTNLTRV